MNEEVRSFYLPGELTPDICLSNLLQALADQRNAAASIEFWERKLRKVREGNNA